MLCADSHAQTAAAALRAAKAREERNKRDRREKRRKVSRRTSPRLELSSVIAARPTAAAQYAVCCASGCRPSIHWRTVCHWWIIQPALDCLLHSGR